MAAGVLLLPTPVAPPGRAPDVPTGWRWPVTPVSVVRGFEPPETAWGAGHRGVDLVGAPGRPVVAAGVGTVGFVGVVAGVSVVTVVHGALRTTYQPVVSSLRVGDRVRAGEVLGRLSATGSHCLPRACLHWGLLRGRAYLDPLALLGQGHVRLLPLTGAGPPPAGIPAGTLGEVPAGVAPG
jgi:murein DD-endopeptidase MepM/ murein hydrolase activator NlpD